MWRTHSCVPHRDSSRCLLVIFLKSEASVEISLDAARTSARATFIGGHELCSGAMLKGQTYARIVIIGGSNM